MTAVITITTLGTDTGPFNLYSDVDGYVSAFATNVSRNELLFGYATDAIPDGTQYVRVASVGICENFLVIPLDELLCYRFLIETGTYYFTDIIVNETQTYVYGTFTLYENGNEVLPAIRIIRLNEGRPMDGTFNVSTGFDSVLYEGNSITQQPDGKIIATGNFTSYKGVPANRIIRLNTDASIDGTFIYGSGFNGFTLRVGIDSNLNIIVTGLYSAYQGTGANRIIRLTPTGGIDGTFVYGSGFNNTTVDVLINPDDSMYITGYFNQYKGVGTSNGIIKLTSTGSVDGSASFGSGFNPYLPNNPNKMIRLPGETGFYAVGYFTSYRGVSANRIIKINADGTIDGSVSFGSGFDAAVNDMYIIWGDKLFIVGTFTSYNGTPSYRSVVLNPDGSIFYAFSYNVYYFPFPIGNIMYGAPFGECLQPIYYFEPTSTTTSSTSTTSTTSTSTTITTTTTLFPPTTTTTTTLEGSELCYEIEQCTTGDIYYVSMTTGCIFGSLSLLFSNWSVGEYVQFHIGISCPTATKYCAEVININVNAVPTGQITSDTKPGGCFDGMCF